MFFLLLPVANLGSALEPAGSTRPRPTNSVWGWARDRHCCSSHGAAGGHQADTHTVVESGARKDGILLFCINLSFTAGSLRVEGGSGSNRDVAFDFFCISTEKQKLKRKTQTPEQHMQPNQVQAVPPAPTEMQGMANRRQCDVGEGRDAGASKGGETRTPTKQCI